jgi:hypothetical protein
MPSKTLTALLFTFSLAACGGSVDAKEAAYDAYQDGDYASAVSHFETALEGKTSADADFLELKVDHLRALAYVDGKKVVEATKALAGEVTLSAKDYRSITTDLVTAKAFEPAVRLMDLGIKAYPSDEKMAKVKDVVIEAAKNSGDEGANNALAGLGYL